MPSENPPSGAGAPRDRGGVRSVKISEAERGAWSSDRTRRGEIIGDPSGARPAPLRRARGRRLAPSNRMGYSPASLIVVAGPSATDRTAFVERLFDKGSIAVLSIEKVRGMVTGGTETLAPALDLVGKVAEQRLRAGQAVVIETRGLDEEERRPLAMIAQRARRPAHLIALEVSREQLAEEGVEDERLEADMSAAAELRRRAEQGELGEEGYATVLTLTRRAAEGVRQIGFDLDLRSPLD